MGYRVIVIDEENDELLKNEVFDEEYEDSCECEGCEEVCNRVSEMLEEAGIDECDHEEMIEELEGMRLVKKENGGKKKKAVKVGKVVKEKEKAPGYYQGI